MKEVKREYENGKVVVTYSFEKDEVPQDLNDLFDATFGKAKPFDTYALELTEKFTKEHLPRILDDMIDLSTLNFSGEKILTSVFNVAVDELDGKLYVNIPAAWNAINHYIQQRVIPAMIRRNTYMIELSEDGNDKCYVRVVPSDEADTVLDRLEQEEEQ